MTITSLGGIGSTTPGGTMAVTADVPINSHVIVVAGAAQISVVSSNGASTYMTSVTDERGNTYAKLAEYTNGAAAPDGVCCSIWLAHLGSALMDGDLITAASVTSYPAALNAWAFSANGLALAGSPSYSAVDASTLASMTISGLASKQYLFLRAMFGAPCTDATFTVTASHTALANAWQDPFNCWGEFIISTGTADTSVPTGTNSGTTASVMVALKETIQLNQFFQSNF